MIHISDMSISKQIARYILRKDIVDAVKCAERSDEEINDLEDQVATSEAIRDMHSAVSTLLRKELAALSQAHKEQRSRLEEEISRLETQNLTGDAIRGRLEAEMAKLESIVAYQKNALCDRDVEVFTLRDALLYFACQAAELCTRDPKHDGPCNGFPRAECDAKFFSARTPSTRNS